MKQTTIKKDILFEGVGLHTGSNIKVKISPAFPDTGIRFMRVDVKNSESVAVSPYSVITTQLATGIKCGDFPISTIEHLMSALYGLGVDNALIEVDGPEIPILDGSSKPIVEMILDAGIKELGKNKKFLKVNRRIRVDLQDKWIEIIPSRFFKITFGIDFNHPLLSVQKKFVNVTAESYVNDIARARTFGFKNEVESLWKMGLAKGGSLENAVVIGEEGVLNPEGLRFEDEFVRHKILDLVGDISLIGYPILGHIRAYRSGHQLNNQFARALIESTDCYSLVEMGEQHSDTEKELVLEPQGVVWS
ncbi:MAG: UDP-3-O-[3-hydroxymyristoyl] N-acetylglucosamine deacetylase [Deferribacteres bacterium]|jgi:UDP-3-O-[3-hydroxymyristoyl] N-acetylglucosamine deacetylase|nr:UDP-3-O-[3-hydroxymyristoyl] N-acetylglucosamine deacetylase [Deferribacteres bacterium]